MVTVNIAYVTKNPLGFLVGHADRRGGILGFGWGGGKCQSYFYGRGDFSEFSIVKAGLLGVIMLAAQLGCHQRDGLTDV